MNEEQLNNINKKRSFLVSQLGEKKLENLLGEVSKFCQSNGTSATVLIDIVVYYRLVTLLPEE